jgi:hypothetical protein
VLILGAGLAGMRAALAARQAAPGLDVLLVCPRLSPSGSSFANRNNALGVQAPLPDEAAAFVDEALRLAAPGFADPVLVRALAADAPLRVEELLDGPGGLALSFRRDAKKRLLRFTGCFSPHPRALVFDGLGQAHAAFVERLRALGVRFLAGREALEIAVADGRARGALLVSRRDGRVLKVAASAVIVATGGPAPLFGRRICGPGPGGGLSYGLLAQAGASLVNTRLLQFFWCRAGDRAFVNPGSLPWETLAPELAHMAQERLAHCPASYSLPDATLDRWLCAKRSADGLLRLPGQPALALYAHAGNGGARIDAQGRTDVPGLYACGECAGGMHGAQRLGGGMVLSALVFGARAGEAAAREAAALKMGGGPDHAPLPVPPCSGLDLPLEPGFLPALRAGMDRHAQPYSAQFGAAREAFAAWLRGAAERAASARQRLLARSALLVLEGEKKGTPGCVRLAGSV